MRYCSTVVVRQTRLGYGQVVATHSGTWIDALPSVGLGLQLGNGETSISIGLRIGAPIVLSHRCLCGSKVLPDGHHGLSCRRSSG